MAPKVRVSGATEEVSTPSREQYLVIFAAYQSARTGRKVALPFTPLEAKKPTEL